MKLVVFMFCLIVFYSGALSQSSGTAKGAYHDVYTKERNITSRLFDGDKAIVSSGARSVYFGPLYEFEGRVPRKFVEPYLSILLLGAEDIGDEPDLFLEIDNQEDGPYSPSRISNYVRNDEKVQHFSLPWGTQRIVRRIADAKTVKGKIGRIEFSLTQNTILEIKSIYLSMPKAPEDLNVTYDSETNITRVFSREPYAVQVKNARYVVFAPRYEYPGKLKKGAASASVIIMFNTNPPLEKGKALDLRLWVDEKAMGPFTAVYLSSQVLKYGTESVYRVKAGPDSIIESIAGAAKVKCTLGDIEFSIAPESIGQIKLLYQKMQEK